MIRIAAPKRQTHTITHGCCCLSEQSTSSSSYQCRSDHHDKGADPADRLEQVLRLCEGKAMPEAEAQKVVNWLDQVNSNCRFIVDELANLAYRV